jgi:Sodium:sulfate symporter transmembrane region
MATGGRITAVLLAAGLAAVAVLGARGTMSAGDARIVAIVFTCIVLWATGAIASLWVSLLFFFLAATCTSVPTAEIFSGFGSIAFWLVFSGAAIGFALKESGLSERIGVALARRLGGSYLKALLAFAMLSFLLSLVMPSTFGRIAILIPIAIGYCDVVKLGADANGRRGILLLVIVGSYELAAAVLPANLPNVIMAGILEQSHGLHLRFSEYLLLFFPAGVIVRGAVLVLGSYWLFADTVGEVAIPAARVVVGRREWHAIVLLAICASHRAGLGRARFHARLLRHVAAGAARTLHRDAENGPAVVHRGDHRANRARQSPRHARIGHVRARHAARQPDTRVLCADRARRCRLLRCHVERRAGGVRADRIACARAGAAYESWPARAGDGLCDDGPAVPVAADRVRQHARAAGPVGGAPILHRDCATERGVCDPGQCVVVAADRAALNFHER